MSLRQVVRRSSGVSMLEKHFQQKVITVAHYYGWLVQHTRAVNSEGRWMTPISGDAGFVDLVLVHPTRGLIFAELKSDRGKISANQVAWIDALSGHAECHVWRPKDLHNIIHRLQGKWSATIYLGHT